jgi:hypothetical protein
MRRAVHPNIKVDYDNGEPNADSNIGRSIKIEENGSQSIKIEEKGSQSIKIEENGEFWE